MIDEDLLVVRKSDDLGWIVGVSVMATVAVLALVAGAVWVLVVAVGWRNALPALGAFVLLFIAALIVWALTYAVNYATRRSDVD